jgi:hypothetical protein
MRFAMLLADDHVLLPEAPAHVREDRARAAGLALLRAPARAASGRRGAPPDGRA